ncbi:MAG: ABC transporter ATP-binding protein [Ignavibacteria bacterium]|nr:ABC transporter ATP-binding protein [Ignavibacteria bacterium]
MVEINKLSKKYNKNEILKNISLSINKGEVTAVVGPNGSGKTTLIKSILGLVKLNSGSVEVDGINIKNNFTYKNNIGYVPQVARYPENLTGNEILSLVKELRTNYEFSSQKIIESFKLSEELNKPFKNLSGGTKQKVSILIALAFNPKIIILDEPTAGLDPVSSSYFKDLILEEKEKKKTIILTSHIMSEIQELADEIIFLLDGEIKFKGTITSLLEESKESKLERAIAQLMLRE